MNTWKVRNLGFEVNLNGTKITPENVLTPGYFTDKRLKNLGLFVTVIAKDFCLEGQITKTNPITLTETQASRKRRKPTRKRKRKKYS
ncbi:hypothetical protein C4569_01205 [Candidatus Parcubacteria bacterium]|nr:MAG: hypothetical protein C4569_01205 [Candidatus Parcubacteria bacterium]